MSCVTRVSTCGERWPCGDVAYIPHEPAVNRPAESDYGKTTTASLRQNARSSDSMAFITEDSDDDSIATDTTADSQHSEDHQFNVEQILAEDTNEDDEKIYLVKWEGYPLHRCTWEGREAFNGDFHLQRWKAKKAAARRGDERLFDVDEYHEAVENAAEEKQERARRRQVKRRKRNEVSGEDEFQPFSPGVNADVVSLPLGTFAIAVSDQAKYRRPYAATQTICHPNK